MMRTAMVDVLMDAMVIANAWLLSQRTRPLLSRRKTAAKRKAFETRRQA